MKIINSRAFQKHIEGAMPNHFSQLYLIIAKDSYIRKTAVDQLVKARLAHHPSPELALKQLQGEHLSVDNMMHELNTTSFFSKETVVCIMDADKLRKACIEAIEEYLAKPNNAITLVLVATEIHANTRLYKKAEKAGIIFDVAEEKPWEKEKSTMEWLVTQFAAEKKTIPHPVCQHIVKTMGTELAFLHQEIEKIICYVGERTAITVNDVNAVCPSINIDNAWQLGEAIFKRDITKALKISKALLAEGTPFFSLIKQIRHQLETDYQVCELLAKGSGEVEISQRFPYMKGSVLDRHIQMAQNYGMVAFRKGLLEIDKTETLAKNSSADIDLLTEMLIIKLM